MYKEENCAPNKNKNKKIINSCLNKRLLIKIAKILNRINKKNNKLKKININESIDNIYEEISKNIRKISKCKSEICWITIKQIMNKLNKNDKIEFKRSFKPIMPKEWHKNHNEWLSTLDIENCLNQYLKIDEKFYFYGASFFYYIYAKVI